MESLTEWLLRLLLMWLGIANIKWILNWFGRKKSGNRWQINGGMKTSKFQIIPWTISCPGRRSPEVVLVGLRYLIRSFRYVEQLIIIKLYQKVDWKLFSLKRRTEFSNQTFTELFLINSDKTCHAVSKLIFFIVIQGFGWVNSV